MSHYDYYVHVDRTVEINISSVTPYPQTSMATVCCASIAIIVVKSKKLELWVLRDNWLVTSRKLNLQQGDNFLLIMKAMSHRAMLS